MIVEIKRGGNLLEITGPEAFITALADQLTYYKQVATKGYKRLNAKFEYVKTLLYKSDIPTKLLAPAGFTRRVYQLCTTMGCHCKYLDLRTNVLPDPDFTALADVDFREGQEQQLVTICSNDCGIIKAPTGFGKTELITWLCRIYPTANIIICAQQQEIVKTLYNRIDKIARDVGIVGAGYNHPNRITISTARSLKKAPLDKCQLLLYDECHTAAADETKLALAAVHDARRFGFSASPYGRHDKADLETEAIFGPVICEIEYQEAVGSGAVADIEVLMFDVPGEPLPYEESVAKERWGFWRNKKRNELIRDIALVLPATDQTLIMVSKVEHGLALKKLLPDYEFIYGSFDDDQEEEFKKRGLIGDDFKTVTSKARDDARKRFESGELKRAIATGVWNTGVDFQHLMWLIRADGGAGEIGNTQTPGRLSRVQHKSCGYLIDFNDKFDPSLGGRSVRRMKSYVAKGWKIRRLTSVRELGQLNANK